MPVRLKKSPGWSGQTISTKKTGLGFSTRISRVKPSPDGTIWVLDPSLASPQGGLVTTIPNPGSKGSAWSPHEGNTDNSPTHVSDGINGLPGLVFGQDSDTDVDMLASGWTVTTFVNSSTYFFVYKKQSASNAVGVNENTLLSSNGSGGYLSRDCSTGFGRTPPNITMGYSGGYPTTAYPVNPSSSNPELLTVNLTDTTALVRINGVTYYDGPPAIYSVGIGTFYFGNFIGNNVFSYGRSTQFVGTICWAEHRQDYSNSNLAQIQARENSLRSYFGF